MYKYQKKVKDNLITWNGLEKWGGEDCAGMPDSWDGIPGKHLWGRTTNNGLQKCELCFSIRREYTQKKKLILKKKS